MNLYHMDDGTHLIAEEAEPSQDSILVRLGIAGVVRRWGTTRGRGQLCLDGPTDQTIVDVEPEGGTVNLTHVRRILPVTPVARIKWIALLERLSGRRS